MEMVQKRGALFLAMVAVLVGVGWSGLAATGPETVRFTFRPPKGAKYTQKLTSSRKVSITGKAPATSGGVATLEAVAKQTPSGYRVTTTLRSTDATRDGKPVPMLLDVALIGVPLTYDLSPDGRVKAVLGCGEAVKRLKEGLGAQKAHAQAQAFSEQAMVGRLSDEWNRRIGDFGGKTLTTGRVVVSADRYALPHGEPAVYYVATRLMGRVKQAGHNCVKLRFDYHTDLKSLGKAVGKSDSQLLALGAKRLPKPKQAGVKITGRGERIIDPATMLIYSETNTRTVTLPMKGPDGKMVTVSAMEKQTYSFKYGK